MAVSNILDKETSGHVSVTAGHMADEVCAISKGTQYIMGKDDNGNHLLGRTLDHICLGYVTGAGEMWSRKILEDGSYEHHNHSDSEKEDFSATMLGISNSTPLYKWVQNGSHVLSSVGRCILHIKNNSDKSEERIYLDRHGTVGTWHKGDSVCSLSNLMPSRSKAVRWGIVIDGIGQQGGYIRLADAIYKTQQAHFKIQMSGHQKMTHYNIILGLCKRIADMRRKGALDISQFEICEIIL